jgi:hypothetical protein
VTFQDENGQQPAIADTGQGHLVGVQPAQPRQASNWVDNGRPDQQVTQPQVNVAPGNGNAQQQSRFFTEEQVEAIRREEKDKLYGRIEQMGSQLEELQAARQAEQEERERLAAEAAEAQRMKEESELEVRDLLTRRETEWQQQLAKLEQRYDADRAIFERERAFNELQEYRRQRVEQESEFILPELRDLITGDNPAAIDASIEVMKARTEQIFANMAAAGPAMPQPRGAAPTSPPVGPMEQMPSYESLTPEDIKGMDMETYKRYRSQLLQATSPNRGRR